MVSWRRILRIPVDSGERRSGDDEMGMTFRPLSTAIGVEVVGVIRWTRSTLPPSPRWSVSGSSTTWSSGVSARRRPSRSPSRGASGAARHGAALVQPSRAPGDLRRPTREDGARSACAAGFAATDGEDKAIPTRARSSTHGRCPTRAATPCSPTCSPPTMRCPTASGVASRTGACYSRVRLHAVHYPHLEPLTEAQKAARPTSGIRWSAPIHGRAERRSTSGDGRVRGRRASRGGGAGSSPSPGLRRGASLRLLPPVACPRRPALGQPPTLHCATTFDEGRYGASCTARRWRVTGRTSGPGGLRAGVIPTRSGAPRSRR